MTYTDKIKGFLDIEETNTKGIMLMFYMYFIGGAGFLTAVSLAKYLFEVSQAIMLGTAIILYVIGFIGLIRMMKNNEEYFDKVFLDKEVKT